MKGKDMTISKHILLIVMGVILAAGMCFMFSTQTSKAYAEEAYGAEGDVIVSGTFKDMSWRIVKTAEGHILELGDSKQAQEFNNGDYSNWSEQDWIEHIKEGISEEPTKAAEKEKQRMTSDDRKSIRNSIPWLNNGYDSLITEVKVVGDIKAHGDVQMWFAGMENVTAITGLDKIDMSDVYKIERMFYFSYIKNESVPENVDYEWVVINNPKLVTVDGYQNWNTSNVRSMGGAMSRCYPTDLDCSRWDTSKVLEMSEVFKNCNFESMDLSGWDTSNALSMVGLFQGCPSLTSIDLSGWNTGNVITMGAMFMSCTKLKEIKGLETFDTKKVVYMGNMFDVCRALGETIDLSKWDTSNVRDMYWMFANCSNLKEVKGLEGFDTSKVERFRGMFYNSKLESAEMLKWDFSSVSASDAADNMFKGATGIADAIAAEADKYDEPTKSKIMAAADAVEAATAGQTGQEALDTLESVTTAGKFVTAADAKAAADTAVTKAKNAENQAKIAKDALEAAKAENPQDPAKIETDQKAYEEKAKAADEAVKAAEEAVAKAVASAEATGDDTMKANAQAVADKFAPVKAANEARTAADAADAAKKTYEDAKKKADEEAAKNQGSDAAVKAAEEATAKAKDFQKAADDAVKAAEATGDQAKIDAAKAVKAEADKAVADAAKLEAEQKIKRAQNNPSDANKKAAEDAANKALDAAKKAYGENSTQAQAAQKLVDTAKALPTTKPSTGDGVKVGDTFTYGKNKYKITQLPGDTWDGEVTFTKAKNKKSVVVPKTVKYQNKTYEVTRVGTRAFRAKKIRTVTIGANVEKINAKAFQKSKAKKLIIKTKQLTKKRVKGSLKGSKVKTIKVKVGSKKVNKKYVKKYKKIFTKKNAGKKVKVKR